MSPADADVPGEDRLDRLGGHLPTGWTVAVPQERDATALLDLVRRHEQAARGRSSTAQADVDAAVADPAGPVRRHLMVRDASGGTRGWARADDRAAGRVLVSVVVDPDLEQDGADAVAATLFAWATGAAVDLARERGLTVTQIDSGAFADDARQQRWLARAEYEHTRTWLQMSRPVTAADARPGALAPPHPSVVVRRVRRAADGMPDQADLVTVHDVLEEAFTDHFNYRTETFDEFCARLRADPGHRWDHWWVAELVDGSAGAGEPVGALVGTAASGPGEGPAGSYVAYLGVLRAARGRGVARSLLHAVIVDAAERGRDRVGLEVDADSPTGAVDLYTSTGFVTAYTTQSWHRDVAVRR